MSFLHPWALGLGAFALALPVAIHWMTRPRPRRFPLSTLRFVREVIHQRRTFHRLRNFLILLLRTAAVALLAWAFARPLIGERPLLSEDDTVEACRVVILDVSQSMGAEVHGITAFERARPVASRHLQFRSGLRANLILAGARPRAVFDRCSSNFAALNDELAEAGVRPERLDVSAAVSAAAEMLAEAAGGEGQRRELVVISDFQRSGWVTADFSPLPEDTRIQLEGVSPAQPPPNVGILRVGSQGRAERGREVWLEVEIGNYSDTPRTVQAEMEVGGTSYQLEGLCPPSAATTLTTEIKVPAAGWQHGSVRLAGVEDALDADDARPFVLEVHPRPVYALITREREEQQGTSSYYLARALVPAEPRPGQPVERVEWIAPTHVTRESLADADLIVLDRPGKLSSDSIALLSALVRRGRALLYVTAEPVDATNLKLLSDAAGTDLSMPVAFVPPAPGQVRNDLFLLEIRRDDAPFRVFGDRLAVATGKLRFSGGLASKRLEQGLAEDVVAVYSDQSACLVVTACGAGSLAVLNADLAASNLVRSPAFVPLLGELVGRLLGERRMADSMACGEPMASYLPTVAGTTEDLEIRGPEAAGDALGELVEEGSWVVWRSPVVPAPGIYEVTRDDETIFAQAAAVPGDECDLQTLEASVLKERLAGGRQVHYRGVGAAQDQEDDSWTWFLVACVGCLLVELMALKLLKT